MNTTPVILLFSLLLGLALCATNVNTIQLHVFEGSTKSWLAVDPRNEFFDTKSVEVREYQSMRWVPAVLDTTRGYYQVSSRSTGGFKVPLSFRFTATNGNRVVARDIMGTPVPGAMVDTLVQYSRTVQATPAPTTTPSTKAPTPAPTPVPPVPTQASTSAPVGLCNMTTPKSEAVQIMVPLYVYPGPVWDQLIAVAATGVKIIAIINPMNGPLVTGPDYAYSTYMKKFQDANIDMVGYVHTVWGERPIKNVTDDINVWAAKYTGIKGIFFDEGAVNATHVPYYSTLYNLVKSKGWVHSILNPGVQPDEGYLAISTNIVIFENFATTLINTFFDGWVGCAPNAATKVGYKYRFTSIIHSALLADMPWLIAESHRKGMGIVYVTDGPAGCCTYNELTTYFTQLGASVKSFNAMQFT